MQPYWHNSSTSSIHLEIFDLHCLSKAHLNVDQGSTFTLWPIIDILCNVGCRLNTITSPSLMWRSTWQVCLITIYKKSNEILQHIKTIRKRYVYYTSKNTWLGRNEYTVVVRVYISPSKITFECSLLCFSSDKYCSIHYSTDQENTSHIWK